MTDGRPGASWHRASRLSVVALRVPITRPQAGRDDDMLLGKSFYV
jgi:hypothetical protein